MTITVNTPDGGTASFPDDTPKDAIVGAMKSKFGGPDDSGGALNTAANVAKSFSDTFTFGTGDYLRSLMTGEDLSKLRESSKKAHEDLGLWDLPVTIAGYTANPFGMAGVGERVGAGLVARGVPKLAAYGAGAATEGATAQTLGDIGHGEAPGWDVVGAGALSAPLGAAVGGRGRAVLPAVERAVGKPSVGSAVKDLLGPETPPPAAVTKDVLEANKKAAYDVLERTPIKPPTVGNALSSAISGLTPGQEAGLSGGMRAQIKQVSDVIDNAPKLTLGDVDNFQKSIGSVAARGGTDADKVAAAKVGEALRALGGQPMKDAQMAQARLGDTNWLSNADPTTVAAEAAKRLANQRMNYDPAGRMAMTDLANSAPGPWTTMAQNALGSAATMGAKVAAGHVLGGLAGHADIGSIIGLLAGKESKGSLAQAYRNYQARKAMKAALASTSQPGVYVNADSYRNAPWLRQAARQAVYARGASDND
jgi:hypothetical protein